MYLCMTKASVLIDRVHPRWKRQVAFRLALAGYAVAYADFSEGQWQGPTPTSFDRQGASLLIVLGDSEGDIEQRDTETSVHYEV